MRLPGNDNETTVHLKELQTKIAGGDENAFSELYFHYGKKLILFAVSLVRVKEIAEEVVEDVFVSLWSNRHKISRIENLTVYLYVSVKNRSLNSLSQKAKEMIAAPFDYIDTTIDEFAVNPYELMITSEIMDRMQQVIKTLPPRCKMIFKLVREDGLKYKEVAEILNISVNTIDVQMAIAVKKICEALQISRPGKFRYAISTEKNR